MWARDRRTQTVLLGEGVMRHDSQRERERETAVVSQGENRKQNGHAQYLLLLLAKCVAIEKPFRLLLLCDSAMMDGACRAWADESERRERIRLAFFVRWLSIAPFLAAARCIYFFFFFFIFSTFLFKQVKSWKRRPTPVTTYGMSKRRWRRPIKPQV